MNFWLKENPFNLLLVNLFRHISVKKLSFNCPQPKKKNLIKSEIGSKIELKQNVNLIFFSSCSAYLSSLCSILQRIWHQILISSPDWSSFMTSHKFKYFLNPFMKVFNEQSWVKNGYILIHLIHREHHMDLDNASLACWFGLRLESILDNTHFKTSKSDSKNK